MSVKKLLILAAAGIASLAATSAFAGGPDQIPVAPAFQPKVYIEGDVGYGRVNWRDFAGTPFSSFSKNSRGGVVGGGALGYWFERNLAVELGAFYLPRVNGTANLVFPAAAGNTIRITNWMVYLAGKLTVPVPFLDNLDIFGKLGVFYRELRYSGTGAPGNDGYWGPFLAIGTTYMLNENWALDFQYVHVPTRLRVDSNINERAPYGHLYMFSIEYLFDV